MNKLFKKVIKMNTLLKRIRNNKGNSLAEFAVTAAMMATLATTAAPRFSGVGDAAKANQTKANIDKIGKIINQFYMDKSNPASATNPGGEGQGRTPGQLKYDVQIGDYTSLLDVIADLTPVKDENGNIVSPANYSKWDKTVSTKWRSIFGTELVDPSYLGNVSNPPDNGSVINSRDEWNQYLSESEGPITSPYRQGHYIYVVIKGGVQYYIDNDGNAAERECNACGPVAVVADAYNPSKYYAVKSFN
jgi:hypothetical protein